ncbi:MAG: UvrB/UvrC motif-containing protein [Eubacteriales bacterium]|nr:UvrB/UvrC motif-containing protein [Eubacteriales bacterium]
MLCQNCNKKTASVHFVKVINDVKTEMHLCDTCAAANQEVSSVDNFDITVSDIINSFFTQMPSVAMPSMLTCHACGLSFDNFSKTGKLGCSICYDDFGDKIQSTLNRIHGSVKHMGKIPKRSGSAAHQIAKLQKQLEDAIAQENYEQAAVLRDEIRKLEEGDKK